MKREHFHRVRQLIEQLSAAETKLAHFEHVGMLSITSSCCLDLQDYPEPSDLGRAFRTIRDALVDLHKKQIANLTAELEALGVKP